MLSTEIVELQIGLKNYDPQKDKRLSGSVKIGLMYALCVLFEDKEVGEDKEKTLEKYEKAKGVEKSDANLKTEVKSDVEEEWMKLFPVELVKVCENVLKELFW
ncbi:hypothetical protein C5167_011495 [Papaver somniferum]|uniref:Uncharacterized protein n=1 Tax=Papaver somniferum TaxID=3469 RepID=A0A4Y7K636_PAPSO|nr:hypothetical protein C5167_011495 [Papaver somniferum]